MKSIKYLTALITLALLIAVPGMVNAIEDQVITDPEGDVESPDIDIIRVELSESGGVVTVSLTVAGTIRDEPGVKYDIFLRSDEELDFANIAIYYQDGEYDLVYNGPTTHEYAGGGTDTLTINIPLEDIGDPDFLVIHDVVTNEEVSSDTTYMDTIVWDHDGDDNGAPENGDDDGDDNDDDDDSPGFALVILLISVSFAILIYNKKKR